MSEIHIKSIENLLWQNFSMYIEQGRDSPEPYTMGVPGFALDGRGRIWIHSTRTLRIYDPDFELVDERETWSKLRIFNAVGGVQIHLLCDLRSNTAVEVGFASDDLEEVDEYWSDEH